MTSLTSSPTETSSTAPAAWNEPEGLSPRGTVIVLAGRGESAGLYARFGKRISSDSYRVRVVEGAASGGTAGSSRSKADARGRVLALLADADLPSPKVLAGSDAGAVLALAIAAEHPHLVAAVIAAGVIVPGGAPGASTSTGTSTNTDEYALRSACPVHRRALDTNGFLDRGALAIPLPAGLTVPAGSELTVPVLGVHGADDLVSPIADALDYYAGVANSRVIVTGDGLHDALNDLTHRSVAASIVLFLERLRLSVASSPPLTEYGTFHLIEPADVPAE